MATFTVNVCAAELTVSDMVCVCRMPPAALAVTVIVYVPGGVVPTVAMLKATATVCPLARVGEAGEKTHGPPGTGRPAQTSVISPEKALLAVRLNVVLAALPAPTMAALGALIVKSGAVVTVSVVGICSENPPVVAVMVTV